MEMRKYVEGLETTAEIGAREGHVRQTYETMKKPAGKHNEQEQPVKNNDEINPYLKFWREKGNRKANEQIKSATGDRLQKDE